VWCQVNPALVRTAAAEVWCQVNPALVRTAAVWCQGNSALVARTAANSHLDGPEHAVPEHAVVIPFGRYSPPPTSSRPARGQHLGRRQVPGTSPVTRAAHLPDGSAASPVAALAPRAATRPLRRRAT